MTRDERILPLSLIARRRDADVLVVDDVDLLPAERARLAPSAAGRALAATASAVAGRAPPRCFATCSLLPARYVGIRTECRRPAPRGHRRLLEVPGVRGNVALRREAATVLATLAGAEELDGIGNDIHRLALVALLVLPLAPLEPSVDRHRAALREVLGAVLALRAPDGDVEVVGLVDPLAGRVVLAAGVDRDPQAAHRGAARRAAELGVAGEVPGDHDPVDVGCCHVELLPSSVVLGRLDSCRVESTNGGRRSGERLRTRKLPESAGCLAKPSHSARRRARRPGIGVATRGGGEPPAGCSSGAGASAAARAATRVSLWLALVAAAGGLLVGRRRGGLAGLDLDDAEAQHAVEDPQPRVEPLEQGGVALNW